MPTRLEVLETAATTLRPISEPKEPTPTESALSAHLSVILFVLKLLGANTVAVAGHLLPLISVGLGFALWWRIMDNPNAFQLGGLGLYAIFALAMIWIRRK